MCDYTSYCTKVYNMSDSPDLPIPFLEIRQDVQYGSYIIMDIGEPVTIYAKENIISSTCFTTYLIRVETNYPTFTNTFSAVRRRYSEFCWLRSQLLANHPDEVVPALPRKQYLRFLNFNSKVITERLRGLNKFLQRVLETPAFLSDPALLFFLQSDQSVAEITRENAKGQPVSFHTSQDVSVDPIKGQKPSPPISLNSEDLSLRENRLVRRLSTESDGSDRISSDDGLGYESSKADSGHFEESLSADCSQNAHPKKSRRISAVPKSLPGIKATSNKNTNINIPSPTVDEMFMYNPMACFLHQP